MAFYNYTSLSPDGKRHKGIKEATSEADLKVKLKNNNEYLISCQIAKEKRRSNFLTASNRVPPKVVATFCRQFAILIETGVPLVDALNTLRKQNFSTYFRNVISDIYDNVLKGVYLSEAFKKYPKIFKSFFINMIRVGEISGNLDVVLVKVADYMENDQKIKSKTKSAMVYPTFLLILVVIVSFALMIFVIPEFEKIITSTGGKLPMITQVILNISRFFVNYWIYIIPITIAVIGLLFLFFKKTNPGKYIKNFFAIHIPVIKNIAIYTITTRFCTAFSILISSGLSVIDALTALIPILDNRLFETKFIYAIEDIKRGKRIAPSIEKCDIFPKMLIEMLDVGEETGRIPQVCDTVANYYQTELSAAVTRATSLLEPIVIIILGILVGIVILAVMLPIMDSTINAGGDIIATILWRIPYYEFKL